MNKREAFVEQIRAERAYVYESMLTCSGHTLEGKHFLMLTQEELDAFCAESPAFQKFFEEATALKKETGEDPPSLPAPYQPDWDNAILGFLREYGFVPQEEKSHRHRRSFPKSKRRFKR